MTELCTGGELFEKLIKEKSFTEKKAYAIILQILSAIFYCHTHKIVHRDLKPENLLYESNVENAVLKVIDFGTSRTFDPNIKMNQKFGTVPQNLFINTIFLHKTQNFFIRHKISLYIKTNFLCKHNNPL